MHSVNSSIVLYSEQSTADGLPDTHDDWKTYIVQLIPSHWTKHTSQSPNMQ